MKLPFCGPALLFAAGIIGARYFPSLSAAAWLPGLMTLPLLWFFRGKKIFAPLFLGAFFLWGACFGHFDATKPRPSLESRMAGLDAGRPVVLFGKVVTEPETKTKGRKVTGSFVLEASKLGRRTVDGKVQVFLFQPAVLPEVGDEIRLWGKVQAVPGAMNPGQFNYREYLSARDIRCLMNVYGKGSMRILRPAPAFSFGRTLGRIRKAIGERIDTLFPAEDRVFIRALILGDRKNLDARWKNDFLKTGTSHLIPT